MYTCSERTKHSAYFTMVDPHLEYASSAWDPYAQQNHQTSPGTNTFISLQPQQTVLLHSLDATCANALEISLSVHPLFVRFRNIFHPYGILTSKSSFTKWRWYKEGWHTFVTIKYYASREMGVYSRNDKEFTLGTTVTNHQKN